MVKKKRRGTITINGKTTTTGYGDPKAKIRPGTPAGNAYCKRSLGIQKKHGRTPANVMSRAAWGCSGPRSYKDKVRYYTVKGKKKR